MPVVGAVHRIKSESRSQDTEAKNLCIKIMQITALPIIYALNGG